MYNTTTDYKTAIKEPSRSFECRITIGNNIYINKDIVKCEFNTIQAQDGFSIGNTIAQNMDLTLFNKLVTYPSVGKVIVEIGLKIGNSIEYIHMGTYNIDDVEKNDFTVKLTCYDNMVKFETPYFSSLGDTPILQQVVDELATITGMEFVGTVPNYVVTKLQGYTCREVLAYVASVCGGNAFITRDGKFTIVYPTEVDCTITGSNYITYKREEETYKIGMITCQNKDNSSSSSEDYDSINNESTISVGSLASDSMELTFKNPWVTESILNDIYNKLKDFSYLGYTMKWQGDLSLDIGDIITVNDVKGVTRKAYVSANKLTYTGGLIAETSAKGETKNSNSFSSSGPGTKNIERLAVKLLIAEKAIITKATIKDLESTNAKIGNLDVSIAKIDTALINYAKVEQLDVVKANIVTLLAADATINSALINKVNIADLNATNANISNLDATVANIQTLINGNLTSSNIQSLVLSSDKVTVQNGFIKNAMIESLDVDKINAGTLNTNKISVSSSDGGLVIAGATQQFKDSSGNVRLQLGQDATGDFNFILKAEDGTTTLIDGYGVTENAIADGLIKTDMVADQAVTGDKINYSSFVTGFNEATNANYINASKVAIDLEGQTLDIAFNNMSTTIEEVSKDVNYDVEIISSNGSIFKNGQISTILLAIVRKGATDITDTIDANRFRWTRKSEDTEGDSAWNTSHFGGTKEIVVTKEDVNIKATFNCEILDM